MKKNYQKGSYTVEAAVIMSLTFFVLVSLIICTFYLHDRVVMQGAACEAAAAGSNFAAADDGSKAALAVKKQMTAGRLLGSRNLQGSTAAGSREATAAWNAVYPVPGFVMKYLTKNSLSIHQTWTCKIPDPSDTIRKIRGAGELLTGGDK